jgi:hypothetical protein
MVKRTMYSAFAIFCLFSTLCFAVVPDFGPNGLKDLDSQQIQRLDNGEIVFSFTKLTTQEHSGLIEAAVIFNQTPEQTWNLLHRAEDQVKYLKEIKEAKVSSRNFLRDTIEFKARFAFMTFICRVNLTFDKEGHNFCWRLDKKHNNDCLELYGFWRFYPYGQGKTLARYGFAVSLKHIPTFIEDMFKKSVIARSLASVKKYVDSAGNETLSDWVTTD